MMRLKFFSFLTLLFAFTTQTALIYAAEGSSEKLAVQISAQLSVADSVKAGDFFCNYSETSGGYYILKSDNAVSIRLPLAALADIEPLLRKQGKLIEYNINSSDIGSEYLTVVKQLNARVKLLADYEKLAAASDFSSTLSLERELMAVLNEIESFKGRINKMENDYKFIKIDISFLSENNRPPVRRASSFEWINKIDFYRFAGGYYD